MVTPFSFVTQEAEACIIRTGDIKMEKFLFFDIDGTLVGKSRQVTTMNKRGIEKAKENGHKVFLCTGRAPTSIVGSVNDIDYDGVVASAGGFVMAGGAFIFKNYINKYVLSEVMTLFVNHHVLYCLETEKAIYQTPGVNEFFDEKHHQEFGENVELQRFFELKRQEENRRPIKDFDIMKTGVTKVAFIAPDKLAFYDCVQYLSEYFNIVIFSKETDDFLNGEIILKECTKADGVRKIVDYFHGSMNDTIGFGDSMNDYQMIEACAIGVVSENAPDKLKRIGDYFFEDPDEDGIFKVLKELQLL